MSPAWMLAAWALGLAAAARPQLAAEPAVRLGVVTRWPNGCHVLQLAGPPPAAGTPVQLVRPSWPQSVVLARAVSQRACFDGAGGPARGRRVALALGDAALEPGEVAIGIVAPARPVEVHEGHASLDPGDGVPLRFRACTTAEALHLTAWSGKPLEGPRRWHAYHHLGYDTAQTCQEPDWRP
jgi:hypothetical protein